MKTDRLKITFFLLGIGFTLFLCTVGALGFALGCLADDLRSAERLFSIAVVADQGWQATHILVEVGDRLTITQTGGEWSECPNYGCPFRDGNGNPESDRDQSNNVLGGCHHAALIGRISQNSAFCIGTHYSTAAPVSGFLELRINDNVIDDNQGVLYVRIERQRP
ncbi:MAG: hypothetical protein JXB85_08250 [Anaerolineales bacterium]|nr:hypothetical protein [Anaerolineales bacterium]